MTEVPWAECEAVIGCHCACRHATDLSPICHLLCCSLRLLPLIKTLMTALALLRHCSSASGARVLGYYLIDG